VGTAIYWRSSSSDVTLALETTSLWPLDLIRALRNRLYRASPSLLWIADVDLEGCKSLPRSPPFREATPKNINDVLQLSHIIVLAFFRISLITLLIEPFRSVPSFT